MESELGRISQERERDGVVDSLKEKSIEHANFLLGMITSGTDDRIVTILVQIFAESILCCSGPLICKIILSAH